MAGLGAGLVVGVISHGLYILGICQLCLIAIGGGFFARRMLAKTAAPVWTILGWIDHLLVSMVLGVILVYILHYSGRDYALIKGAIFGAVVWLVTIGIISPLAGYIPPSPQAIDLAILLAYHILYGILAAWLLLRFHVKSVTEEKLE
jgi:FtsH-binding integral membrane protein